MNYSVRWIVYEHENNNPKRQLCSYLSGIVAFLADIMHEFLSVLSA